MGAPSGIPPILKAYCTRRNPRHRPSRYFGAGFEESDFLYGEGVAVSSISTVA